MGVFEVAVGPGRQAGTCRVEVVRSEAGEASAEAALDAAGLLARRGDFELTVMASAVTWRQVLSPAEQVIRDAGQELFAALLGTEPVAGRYQASAALAAQRGEGLRVVLRVDAPDLAGLPWEAMYDPGARGYVCRLHELVRHVPVAAVPPPLGVRLPLRVLGVISAPRGLPALDAGRERDQLERALAGLGAAGRAEVAWAEPTWAGLHEKLLDGPWHVLHFIGHGSFDAGRDAGVLALTGTGGEADLVEAARLADLLRRARPMPRLVVLSSCSGGTASPGDLFSGTAAALARGRGVDDAVSDGRISILGTGSQTLEWITPVLYLRGADARLFDIAAPAEAAAPLLAEVVRARLSPARPAAPAARPVAAGPTRVARIIRAVRGNRMRGAAFSPDGSLLATIPSHGGRAQLWDADTGELARGLTDPRIVRATAFRMIAVTLGVAFSPDGTLLATGCVDKRTRLWQVADGTLVRVLEDHTGTVEAVAFSPDGALLATASSDGTVMLREVSTGTTVRILTGLGHTAYDAAFSPDGTLLATAGGDGAARLWDAASGALVRVLPPDQERAFRVAFSPDGSRVATGHAEGARLWDTGTGVAVHDLPGSSFPGPGSPSSAAQVAFSRDGTLLATTGYSATVRLWDAEAGTLIRTLTAGRVVRAVTFGRDGLLAGTTENGAWLWE